MIELFGSSRFKIDRKLIHKIVSDYLTTRAVDPNLDINIVFVGKRKMLHIATTYKHEAEALPVLSFPYLTEKKMPTAVSEETPSSKLPETDCFQIPGSERNLLGEVFICYPQAVLLAAERNKRVDVIMKFLLEHAIENLLK